MTNFNQVHQGYEYQDIMTAYLMSAALFTPTKTITVDQKSHDGDLFDDIKTTLNGKEKNFQLKFSEDPNLEFTIRDLKTKQRGIRLDDLIHSHKNNPRASTSEYFLVTTLLEPNDELLDYMTPAEHLNAIPGKAYRILPEKLWPRGSNFTWGIRKKNHFSRTDLVDFCDRFTIYVDTPRPSFDLRSPGELEQFFLNHVHNEIGIGHYPNHKKEPVETGATLIHLANSKRGSTSSVNGDGVAKYIQLRRDYGKISQEFPVDQNSQVERSTIEKLFLDKINSNKCTILKGSPGSGKSWLVTNVIDKLRSDDKPVAYHYCFLSPFDTLVQQRISQKTLYGNLVSTILQELPSLKESHRPYYSATKTSLQNLLDKASEVTDKLYIFVDGLDHIDRIKNQYPHISSGEASILPELEAINLPSNIHMILSSQPGPHLKVFEDISTCFDMPEWGPDESIELTKKIVNESEFDDDEWEIIKISQHERAQGNPLYLTYIADELKTAIANNQLSNIESFFKNLPVHNGNIESYYNHLLNTLRTAGQEEVVADIFGLVEFSLTEDELSEILGALQVARLPDILSILKPIIVNIDGQGGYRIYHDSFRRFIYNRLNDKGVAIKDALQPVLSWMDGMGVLESQKCYTFYFHLLSRAEEIQKILSMVTFDFLIESVSKGFPFDAIDTNLTIAISSVDSLDKIPKVIQIWEFRRALYTCFDDRLQNGELFHLYNRCAGKLNGWEWFANNLLFDGEATLNKYQGIIACADADRYGAIAPWQEYMNIPDDDDYSNNHLDIQYEIAFFRGALRNNPNIKQKIVDWLSKTDTPKNSYFDGIVKAFTKHFGIKEAVRIVNSAKMKRPLYFQALVNICELAKKLSKQQFLNKVEIYLMKTCDVPDLAFRLMRLGFNLSDWQITQPDITKFNIGLSGKHYHQDENEVKAWANTVVILAFKNLPELSAFKDSIRPESWYRGWLKFYIKLCVSAAEHNQGNPTDVSDLIQNLEDLSKFSDPFTGAPRVCDLYNLRPIILASFDLYLSFIKDINDFKKVIPILRSISSSTTTYIQGSPGGPLIHYKLIYLLGKYLRSNDALESLMPEIEEIIKNAEAHGEYYEIQAEFQIKISEFYFKLNKKDKANAAFKKACKQLCSYGHRKDATIYELIESLPTVSKTSNDGGFEISYNVMKILGAIFKHTDLKGTKYVFIDWLDSVLEFLPAPAVILLGDSITKDGGEVYWQLEECFERVIETTGKQIDRNCLFSLEYGLRCDDDYSIRFSRMDKLLEFELHKVDNLFKPLLFAHFNDDSRHLSSKWRDQIRTVMGDDYPTTYTIPKGTRIKEKDDHSGSSHLDDNSEEFLKGLHSSLSPRELIRYIRQTKVSYFSEKRNQGIANFFGYRLISLSDNGQLEVVNEIISVLEQEFYFSNNPWFWEELGLGFNRYNKTYLAAKCFIIAYARSKANGWMSLGGAKAREHLTKAFKISPHLSKRFYIEKVKELASGPGYGLGLSHNVIEDLFSFGLKEDAKKTWDFLFEVISNRLETKHISWGPFSKSIEMHEEWSLSEAIAYLILCRITHPEKRRKMSSFLGIVHLLKRNPGSLIKGLKRLLSKNITCMDLTILLELLWKHELTPNVVSHGIKEQLKDYLKIDQFGIRSLCFSLLHRIKETDQLDCSLNTPRESVIIVRPDRDYINYLDRQNRVSTYSRVIKELPEQLSSRFNSISSTETFRKECRKKHEQFYSNITKLSGLPKYIRWEQIIFDSLLQNQLLGRDFEIASLGLSQNEVYKCWMGLITSDSTWLLRKELSRIARPEIILPEMAKESDDLEVSVLNGGKFNGWYILGEQERQVMSVDRVLFEPSSTRFRLSGVIFYDNYLPNQYAPFTECTNPEDYTLDPPLTESVNTPTVNEWSSTPWGRSGFLRLNSQLVNKLNLKFSTGLQAQEYLNQSNEVVVKCQNWKTWFCGSDLGKERRLLEGENLIVREDIWNEIKTLMPSNIVYRTIVFDMDA